MQFHSRLVTGTHADALYNFGPQLLLLSAVSTLSSVARRHANSESGRHIELVYRHTLALKKQVPPYIYFFQKPSARFLTPARLMMTRNYLGKNLLHTEEQRTREMLSRLRRLPPDELSVVVEHVALVRELGGAELHRDELARQHFDGAVVVAPHIL